MREKIPALIVIAALFAGAIIFLLIFHDSRPSFSGTPEPIVIGSPALETSALIYIADDQHYFENNGLLVTYKVYDSGGATFAGLLRNEVDIAMASEFVIATGIIRGENITGLATTDKFQNMFLVGEPDNEISGVPKVKGKTIGIPRGTIADFYLGRYLNLHGYELTDVNLTDVRPSSSSGFLANRTFDAVVTWHPYVDMIPANPGRNLTVLPIQSGQDTFWIAVTREEWVRSHPEMVNRFLKAVAQAETYSQTHPLEAQEIVRKRLGYDRSYLERIWTDNRFSLSLDQSLVTAMEDEARWMIANNLTNETSVPDFRRYIYTKSLEEIKPGSVRIIG
jgi:ABC-type nitrate/sulfonate/bicarbonate transport system substrate-binding protein